MEIKKPYKTANQWIIYHYGVRIITFNNKKDADTWLDGAKTMEGIATEDMQKIIKDYFNSVLFLPCPDFKENYKAYTKE